MMKLIVIVMSCKVSLHKFGVATHDIYVDKFLKGIKPSRNNHETCLSKYYI